MSLAAVDAWEGAGVRLDLAGHRIFVRQAPARVSEDGPPLLALHGFPTSSFDYRHVLDRLSERRRVVTLDFLGFGLSDKPDQPYLLTEQADIVDALLDHLGLREIDLLTHDMGDTIGGELLARELDGTADHAVRRRVVSNGSVHIEMANLTDGQRFLLALDDARLPLEMAIPPVMLHEGLKAICGPDTPMGVEELEAQWDLVAREDGHLLAPRLIRYVEQRREHERRWTGAIERHPAPLTIVWGDRDPVAVHAMAERLHADAPGSRLVTMEGIGHFPMIEAPDRFADAVLEALRG